MSKVCREACMSNLPLRRFERGQRLYYKVALGRDYTVFGPGEFMGIERGYVLVKYLPGWEPDWYDSRTMATRYPTGIIKVRPQRCHLWGCGPHDLHEHCHLFRSLDDPVDDMMPSTLTEEECQATRLQLSALLTRALSEEEK